MESEQENIQRRRSTRYKVKKKWSISFDSLYGGELGNLSIYGVFIKTDQEMVIDSIVSVDIQPPTKSEKKALLKAKVAWTRKDRMGVYVGAGLEFIDPTKKQIKVLSYYVDLLREEKSKNL
ncbi:PilZ domain-containing protein [Thermodesulfobacteriota bacterium]